MIKANFNAYSTYVTDSLYQWDINQVLSVTGLNLSVVPEVHFSNASMDRAIVRQASMVDRVVKVDIPNSLLQDPLTIKAHIGIYEGDTFKVVELVEIPVIARKRPSDYQIQGADEEIYSFKALENAISNMTTKAEANVISARIDTIVANANKTDGNSELVDMRVDIDGVVHDSAGAAVREQIGELKGGVEEVYSLFDTANIVYTLGAAIASTGSYATNLGYSMASLDYIYVKKGSYIRANNSGYSFNIAIYSDADKTAFKSAKTGQTFFKVSEDCYIRFSLRNLDTTVVLGDDSIKNYFTIVLKQERIAPIESRLANVENIAYRNVINGKYFHVWGKRAVNFDQFNKTLTLPGTFWIVDVASGERYENPSNVEIDISAFYGNAGMCYVLFDTTTKQIRVVGTNKDLETTDHITSRRDTELIFASFLITRQYAVSTFAYIIKDVQGFDYTVNGLSRELYEKTLFNLRLPSIPSHWFAITDNLPYHNVTTMDYSDIYAGYDALVEAYPDYVTRTELGYDASGNYPIYAYTFTPSPVSTSTSSAYGVYTYVALNKQADIPKCVLVTGVHGNEYPSVLAMLNLMTLICTDYMRDEVLTHLRLNVKFVVIPIANPYGFANGTRTNANTVDLNRNFDTDMWANGDVNTDNDRYRGESPASEVETQYIQRIIDDNTDALFAFDIHSHGVWTSWDQITRWDLNASKNADHMFNIGTYVIQGVTLSGWKNHNMSIDSGYIGRIGLGHEYASVNDYMSHKGIESATPEVMWQYYGGERNTVDVEQMNTEYLCNAIMGAIKYYTAN